MTVQWGFYLTLILYIFGLLSFLFKFPRIGFLLLGATFASFAVYFRPSENLFANPWAFAHVLFIFIAMAILLASFLSGFFYLIRERRIKHKKIGGTLDRLPPLELMDHIHYSTFFGGFVFLTLGIMAGAGWSKSTLGVYVTNDFRQLLSFALWFFFALYINVRTNRRWFGRRGVGIVLLGLLALIILFVKFGSRGF